MKTSILSICVLLLFILSPQTHPLSATEEVERWTAGPWNAEEIIAFGGDMLVADFGVNGIWIFNGSWAQLSRLDPKKMVAWGGKNLAVDFGKDGLWNYDGGSWQKIAEGLE